MAVLNNRYCVSAWQWVGNTHYNLKPSLVYFYHNDTEARCAAQLLRAAGFEVEVHQVLCHPSGRRTLQRVLLDSPRSVVGIDQGQGEQ